jgi:nicotine blue oxidoreductase
VTPEVAGVLLAAGGGRRFGVPKALVEVGGRPLVERGATTLLAGGCRPVVVVVGAAAGIVRQRLDPAAGATVVVNGAWREGLGSSLNLGLAEAEALGAAAALVLPVDQPVVTAALVARLVGTWRAGSLAVRAAFGGQGRTPVVLDRTLWPAVRKSAVGDVGARGLLGAHPELVTLVDCDDVGAACDVDTPADLEAIRCRYGAWLAAAPGAVGGDEPDR